MAEAIFSSTYFYRFILVGGDYNTDEPIKDSFEGEDYVETMKKHGHIRIKETSFDGTCGEDSILELPVVSDSLDGWLELSYQRYGQDDVFTFFVSKEEHHEFNELKVGDKITLYKNSPELNGIRFAPYLISNSFKILFEEFTINKLTNYLREKENTLPINSDFNFMEDSSWWENKHFNDTSTLTFLTIPGCIDTHINLSLNSSNYSGKKFQSFFTNITNPARAIYPEVYLYSYKSGLSRFINKFDKLHEFWLPIANTYPVGGVAQSPNQKWSEVLKDTSDTVPNTCFYQHGKWMIATYGNEEVSLYKQPLNAKCVLSQNYLSNYSDTVLSNNITYFQSYDGEGSVSWLPMLVKWSYFNNKLATPALLNYLNFYRKTFEMDANTYPEYLLTDNGNSTPKLSIGGLHNKRKEEYGYKFYGNHYVKQFISGELFASVCAGCTLNYSVVNRTTNDLFEETNNYKHEDLSRLEDISVQYVSLLNGEKTIESGFKLNGSFGYAPAYKKENVIFKIKPKKGYKLSGIYPWTKYKEKGVLTSIYPFDENNDKYFYEDVKVEDGYLCFTCYRHKVPLNSYGLFSDELFFFHMDIAKTLEADNPIEFKYEDGLEATDIIDGMYLENVGSDGKPYEGVQVLSFVKQSDIVYKRIVQLNAENEVVKEYTKEDVVDGINKLYFNMASTDIIEVTYGRNIFSYTLEYDKEEIYGTHIPEITVWYRESTDVETFEVYDKNKHFLFAGSQLMFETTTLKDSDGNVVLDVDGVPLLDLDGTRILEWRTIINGEEIKQSNDVTLTLTFFSDIDIKLKLGARASVYIKPLEEDCDTSNCLVSCYSNYNPEPSSTCLFEYGDTVRISATEVNCYFIRWEYNDVDYLVGIGMDYSFKPMSVQDLYACFSKEISHRRLWFEHRFPWNSQGQRIKISCPYENTDEITYLEEITKDEYLSYMKETYNPDSPHVVQSSGISSKEYDFYVKAKNGGDFTINVVPPSGYELKFDEWLVVEPELQSDGSYFPDITLEENQNKITRYQTESLEISKLDKDYKFIATYFLGNQNKIALDYYPGSNEEQGSFQIIPHKSGYYKNEKVTIVALSKNGYIFEGWYELGESEHHYEKKLNWDSTTTIVFDREGAVYRYYCKFVPTNKAFLEWEGSDTNKTMVWRSRRYQMEQPFNPTAAQIYSDGYENLKLTVDMASSPKEPINGNRRNELIIDNQNARRLPMKRPEKFIEIEIENDETITDVKVSTSMGGLLNGQQ